MPTVTRSRSGLAWTLAGATILCLTALLAGWWLGRQQGGGMVEDSRRSALSNEADLLRQKVIRGEGGQGDRQRYLELLVVLNRKPEAIALLEPMADQEPDRWSLRLMLAELRRNQGDSAGAERELRQILNRQPERIEALQLLTLLLLERQQGASAETQVKATYARLIRPEPRPEAIGVGLLLAELQQKRGEGAAAERTYQELAQAFPQDQRPLIGLALLRHSRGNGSGAQEALEQARLRSPDQGKPDPRLSALAASWGLEKLRAPASGQGPRPARPGPGPTPAPPASAQGSAGSVDVPAPPGP